VVGVGGFGVAEEPGEVKHGWCWEGVVFGSG
jgi:hypothetical protein